MGRKMNDDVIFAGPRHVERIKNVELRAPREVFGVKETAHVRTQVSAATGD